METSQASLASPTPSWLPTAKAFSQPSLLKAQEAKVPWAASIALCCLGTKASLLGWAPGGRQTEGERPHVHDGKGIGHMGGPAYSRPLPGRWAWVAHSCVWLELVSRSVQPWVPCSEAGWRERGGKGTRSDDQPLGPYRRILSLESSCGGFSMASPSPLQGIEQGSSQGFRWWRSWAPPCPALCAGLVTVQVPIGFSPK